jgi:RNA polymerase sigma factor (sigma-70 family)
MARELRDLPTEELLRKASRPSSENFAEAVGELVMRYKSAVYRQALWICGGNRSLADDVFQETFLRLFAWLKQRRGQPPIHSFPRLLQVFAKRAAVDLVRKETREPSITPSVVKGDPLRDLYLVELLDSLDQRSQEVIRLTYFEGLTAPEIAKRLNLKAENVRILRFRALEALRERENQDELADLIEEV